MSIIEAVVLGLVQGVTEFLPISSSGHLVVIPELFGWEEQSLLFDVVVHLGSLAAIVLMLWNDILGVFERDRTGTPMWVKLAVSAPPILLAGFLIDQWLGEGLRLPLVVAISLIFWGFVLWWVDRQAQSNKKNDPNEVTWKTAAVMGLAQALALVPGTSRSGITMIAGMDRGLTRVAASRFSFLMAVPVIAAAGGYKLLDAVVNGAQESWIILIVGAIASFAAGIVSIKFLLAIVARTSFKWFAFYRIALGIVLIIWWLA